MRKIVLLALMLVSMFSFSATAGTNASGRVSLIGEFNGWSGDHFMTRDLDNPDLFTTFITLTPAMESDPANDTIELKFRENADWAVNWGGDGFPTGTGTNGGPNIKVPLDSMSSVTFYVTFNSATGDYNFEKTCGQISLIGEFNGWSDDFNLTRSMTDINSWSGVITLTSAMESDPANDTIELKFRENADWSVNWGSSDFPTGTGVQNGPNIQVPLGTYKVDFNCSTGAFTFTKTCGSIGLIGEFNGWSADYPMKRSMDNPDQWCTILTLTKAEDSDTNGIIELKFRQNADWGVNWGGADFPTGTGTQDGPNIKVPLDSVGITTDYKVTFNCATGEYSFVATSGPVSMIGAFNNWNGDVPMNRDAVDPNVWHLTRAWYADSEVKFRENMDWSHNWGNNTFPTGTGTDNGPNIPLVAGTYDVTFNSATGEYSFVANDHVCGEIGMVGDFNAWGIPDDPAKPATDVYLVRDPEHPSQFSLTYNFTSSTKLLFRSDPNYTVAWGTDGNFPTGVAVLNGIENLFEVPGGKYHITFNCESGDFNFERLGNSVIAPKVFTINVDGSLNENDWNIDQNVSRVVYGKAGDPMTSGSFGLTYNDTYLYVGAKVTDEHVTTSDGVVVFLDGDKSGGDYTDSDVALFVASDGQVNVLSANGNQSVQAVAGGATVDGGYTVELAIPWADLGVTPAEGGILGFDFAIAEDDSTSGEHQLPQYILAWNGDMSDTASTSAFGDLLLGQLSCGTITLYNSTIGDVNLRPNSDDPNTYLATYEFFDNQDVKFRKDHDNTVAWGAADFPSGTATVGGDAIAATTGRYRVSFNCLSGDYSFTDAPAGDNVAYAHFTDNPVPVDGDLSGYNLEYGMNAGVVVGTSSSPNPVQWGALWDADNLYLGVDVQDAVVEGSGNPWDNDAIEFYIDGNNDKDGKYDADFDTQLILDYADSSVLWVKADGVPITNDSSYWKATATGYRVELRLGWDNFHFAPGQGRVIGFSISNNDSDNGVGRDYQTTWYGTGDNWNNTALLGDLQLAEGPLFVAGVKENVLYNSNIGIFPNPASHEVNIRAIGSVFNGNVNIDVTDITGRTVLRKVENFSGANSFVRMSISNLHSGIYFVNIMGVDGKRAVKKLVVE
jgi:hypothetical protein